MDTTGRLKFNNKGFAIIWLAFLLPMFIFVIAIVVDFGYMYVAKGQLQNAADAAALAGAARLNRGTVISAFDNYSGSRMEAWKIASSNISAGRSVFLVYSTAHDSPDRTKLNIGNDWEGDIVVGNWSDANGFRPREGVSLPSGTEINAVKVVARRTSESAETNKKIGNNPVPIIFGRILSALSSISFLGGASMNWSTMSAKAEAVTIKEKAKVLPIAANEYWLQGDPSRRPYPDAVHNYPSSFVRVNNVDGSPSLAFGKTFAILGNDANDNIPSGGGPCPAPGAANVNGYVNLDARTSRHDGAGATWWDLVAGGAGVTCCGSGYSFLGPNTKNTGSIASAKYDASLQYLFQGFPDGYILPAAVREQDRGPASITYPCTNLSIYPEPTSVCPYATVPYFQSSGNQPISKTFNEQKLIDVLTVGTRVVILVYDGTFIPDVDPNMPNAVTIVGYSLVQIDGYSNGNPKNIGLNQNGPTLNVGTDGGTLYAHALADIVQPGLPVPSPPGQCDTDLLNRLNDEAFLGGKVRLVH